MKLIDIGAFNGDTALHFISYPDITSIEAYEPNYDFKPIWDAIENYYPNVRFTPWAVYTYTGEITYFKRYAKKPLGSTVMKEKIQSQRKKTMTVNCVDILDIVPKKQKYCLKIDAEGAEYDILERLINNFQTQNIDRLYVEWHGHKMDGNYTERQKKIEKHFGKRIQPWQ